MIPYKIAFLGNKEVSDPELILNTLVACLEELCYRDHSSYPIFYCGGYGEFSQIACEAIDILRKRYPNFESEKLFVTPYITPSYQPTLQIVKDYYDEIIYPPLESVPLKFAISRRNQWMIGECDALIVYMHNPIGNTRKCVEYAARREKCIFYIGAGRVDYEETWLSRKKSENDRKNLKIFLKISKKT